MSTLLASCGSNSSGLPTPRVSSSPVTSTSHGISYIYYFYDSLGRLSTETNAGQPSTTTYRYDDQNKLRQAISSFAGENSTRTYHYNDERISRMVRESNRNRIRFITTTYSYDNQNQLQEIIQRNNRVRVSYRSYTHDASGRISEWKQIVLPSPTRTYSVEYEDKPCTYFHPFYRKLCFV